MSGFENSWEALDKARNPDKYETVKTEDGKEVTFLKSDSSSGEAKQKFTKEEEENIARAAEIMQDRDDWFSLRDTDLRILVSFKNIL